MEIIIITGPPFSGKGTQCELLVEKLGFKHISTGERCRAEKKAGTWIGQQLSLAEGDYVADDIMRDLFKQILEENLNEKGVILDGYPRTIPQVKDLVDLTKSMELPIKTAINIEVPTEELLKRAADRAKSSDRDDDKNPAVHIRRIRIFEEATLPAIDYMKEQFDVLTISGLGTKEKISQAIEGLLMAGQ